MEYTEHKLTLDVHKTVSNASVALKKGDTAHRLLITLSEGGYPYHIGEDCTVAFSALKPDGTAIFNDCRIEGDTVIYDMTEQTTAEEGMVSCEIKIYGANGDLLTSASFLLFVEEGVNNSGAVVSSGEFSTLTSMVREVNRATAEAVGATERAKKAANACMVIGSAEGEMIRLDDAIDAHFAGLRIFGKTTQNGIPTPANPATLVSVGSFGNIDLTSNDQTIAIPVSGGLHGIPVISGGNYTDANGQQWVCDEIDLAHGVYVQRVGKKIFTGATDEIWTKYPSETSNIFYITVSDAFPGLHSSVCSHFGVVDKAWSSDYISTYGVYSDHDTLSRKYFRPPNESVVTLADWKSWLAENPTTLLYVLATPIETDLPDEVIDAYRDYIQSHSGDTVVSNDSGAHIALEYIMDAKKYIDKMVSTGIHEATLE